MSFPSIILFGDSLTERSFSPGGFGASLANDYHRRADVLNRGLSGYNSQWLLPFLDSILKAQVAEVLYFVILVGVNDAVLPGNVHHVPLEVFKSNVKRMVQMIRAHKKTAHSRILLVTPPPIDIELLKQMGPRGGKDRSAQSTNAYADVVRNVALDLCGSENSKILLVDFHKELLGKLDVQVSPDGLKTYLEDGLHLNLAGYDVLYQTIRSAVEFELPDLIPERQPMMAPWWGDLQVVKDFKEQATVNHEEL